MMKTKVDDDCVHQWEQLKMAKAHRFIIFNISQTEEVVVQAVGTREKGWEDFLQELPKDDMRFGVYDFEFTSREGMHVNKLIFVSWTPDTAKPKRRMIFASCKEIFKKHVPGVVKDYQASCLEDINYEDIKRAFDK